jgi:O-antigen ligase
VFLIAWTTFAFGGVYASTLVIPTFLFIVLAAAYRPWTVSVEERGLLDASLAVTMAAGVFQVIPLPAPMIDTLSPHARAVWEHLSLSTAGALPISVDLAGGMRAVLIAAGCFTVFLTARCMFVTGGIRRVVRGVSFVGLVLAALALAQDATARGLMYWRWAPLEEGAPPFGPFVNRNHFATWVVLAVPLCLGYLAAHAAAHHHDIAPEVPWRRRLALTLDARAIWLCGAVAVMVVGLLVSLSRSGMVGLTVALLGGAWAHSRHSAWPRPRSAWLVAGLALTLLLVVMRVDPAALSGRFSTVQTSAADRFLIWRETLPIIRDFWLTGTGAGTYETAMLVYQRAPVVVRFNQAHNQYLQLVAEGGLLLCVPAALALFAYVAEARNALARDRSGMYWIRAGGACGLAGVAAQSVWETGLSTPANALLAAVVAAIVIHNPGRSRATS